MRRVKVKKVGLLLKPALDVVSKEAKTALAKAIKNYRKPPTMDELRDAAERAVAAAMRAEGSTALFRTQLAILKTSNTFLRRKVKQLEDDSLAAALASRAAIEESEARMSRQLEKLVQDLSRYLGADFAEKNPLLKINVWQNCIPPTPPCIDPLRRPPEPVKPKLPWHRRISLWWQRTEM